MLNWFALFEHLLIYYLIMQNGCRNNNLASNKNKYNSKCSFKDQIFVFQSSTLNQKLPCLACYEGQKNELVEKFQLERSV